MNRSDLGFHSLKLNPLKASILTIFHFHSNLTASQNTLTYQTTQAMGNSVSISLISDSPQGIIHLTD